MKKVILSIFILVVFSCRTNTSTKVDNNIADAFEIHKNLPPNFNIPPQLTEYYSGVNFSDNESLYNELAILTIAKHTNFLYYSERHQYLYNIDEDPTNTNNVILMYSSESRSKNEYTSNKNTHKFQTFNTEHVYPQSKIENTAKGDLHHLRVCDSKINSRRNNHPFTDGSGESKLIDRNSWYPGDEWKGDVARMVMYLNIRYNEPFNEVGSIELFLKWNAEDPISKFEERRNNLIEKTQGNRNPFIDNPYLATLIWGGEKAENKWN